MGPEDFKKWVANVSDEEIEDLVQKSENPSLDTRRYYKTLRAANSRSQRMDRLNAPMDLSIGGIKQRITDLIEENKNKPFYNPAIQKANRRIYRDPVTKKIDPNCVWVTLPSGKGQICDQYQDVPMYKTAVPETEEDLINVEYDQRKAGIEPETNYLLPPENSKQNDSPPVWRKLASFLK